MSCAHSEFAWSKFWWRDYERDKSLRLVSLAAQGLWMRMLCVMAEGSPYGHLTMHGKPVAPVALAKLVGVRKVAVERLLAELEEAGVFSRTSEGTIFSRRMDRERRLRIEARENGAKGGNPALISEITIVSSEINSRNADGTAKRVPKDSNGLDDLGDNPPSNPPSNPPVKPQEAKRLKNSGSLRSPDGKPGRGRPRKPQQVDLDLGSAPPDTAPVPNGSDQPKGKPGAKALFDDGLPKLNAMVGGDNRSLIGGWLKEHPDNAGHIHALIREAHRLFTTPGEALDNPKAWICARLAPKQAGGSDGVVPDEADGWPVYEIAAFCRSQAEVKRDHWPGLERVVYRALMAKLDPEKDIYPIMRSMRGRNPHTTGLGLIVTAFKDRIDGYAALERAAALEKAA